MATRIASSSVAGPKRSPARRPVSRAAILSQRMIIRGGTFGPVATNTYVVADAQGGSAWIVDPAMGSEAWVRETLRRLEATPVAVLDTHGHWDHVVENHVWAAEGLPVWARGAATPTGWRRPRPFNPALFGNPPPTPGVTPAAPARRRRRARAGRPALRASWPRPGTRPAAWWRTRGDRRARPWSAT